MSQSGMLKVSDAILPGDVPTSFVTDSGTAIPIANVIEILGGAGVTTTGVGNVVTINVSGTGFIWNLVTSVSPPNPIQLISENGYSCQGVSLVTFTLPLAPSFGDTFIVASTTSRFEIFANAGQQMRIGSAISTAGSGTATSNAAGDMVEMVYMGSNIFQSMAPQGTISLT
jgi:hypothetical protein